MNIKNEPTTLASGAASSFGLDPSRIYTIAHDREDTTHNPDDGTVYLGFNGVVPDGGVGLNKIKLLAGRSIEVGPGINSVRFVAASGAPTISIIASQSVGINSNP